MSDTSASIKKSGELGDIVDNSNKSDSEIVGALSFYNSDFLTERDRKVVTGIYCEKRRTADFTSSGTQDSYARINKIAKQYFAQKCAFQDILTRKSFEIASEVPKDYSGRIAVLTKYGTLIMIGKQKIKGRHLISTRLYRQRSNYKAHRGNLRGDLKLGERVELTFCDELGNVRVRSHTEAIGLAINPRGADGDELEAATQVSEEITVRKMEIMELPDEKILELVIVS